MALRQLDSLLNASETLILGYREWGNAAGSYMLSPIVHTLLQCLGPARAIQVAWNNHGPSSTYRLSTAVARYRMQAVKPPCAFLWLHTDRLAAAERDAKSFLHAACRWIHYCGDPKRCDNFPSPYSSTWAYSHVYSSRAAYVPPLYVHTSVRLTHEDPTPVFFGAMSLRNQSCALLRNRPGWVRERLREVHSVWSAAAMAQQLGRSSVFINLHRACDNGSAALESFRLSQLLSVGALVVSQRSNRLDEREYEGLVTFANDEQFWAVVAKLCKSSQEERRALGTRRMKRFMASDPGPSEVAQHTRPFVRFNRYSE